MPCFQLFLTTDNPEVWNNADRAVPRHVEIVVARGEVAEVVAVAVEVVEVVAVEYAGDSLIVALEMGSVHV